MISKDKLTTPEHVNNIILNVALVEILVETVKKVVDVNGGILCLIFSVVLTLVTFCFGKRLTLRQLLLDFYNVFLIVFLSSVGCYESIIKILTK